MSGTVLGQRLLYGTLSIAVLLAIVVVDAVIAQRAFQLPPPLNALLARGSLLPILITAALVIAAEELRRMFLPLGIRIHPRLTRIAVILLALFPWLSAAGWLGSRAAQLEGFYWPLFGIMAAIFAAGCASLLRTDFRGVFVDFSATVGTIGYIGFLGSFATHLRCARGLPGETGAWLLLIVLLIIKVTDIGAFFGGRYLGRRKLAPHVSPNKTVEGAVSGVVASALLTVGLVALHLSLVGREGQSLPIAGAGENDTGFLSIMWVASYGLSFAGQDGSWLTWVRAAGFGVVLSIAGQLGDLVESSFKRHAGVKDSGTLIPRFGGILDLVDSPLTAVPAAWFLLTAVWTVG